MAISSATSTQKIPIQMTCHFGKEAGISQESKTIRPTFLQSPLKERYVLLDITSRMTYLSLEIHMQLFECSE